MAVRTGLWKRIANFIKRISLFGSGRRSSVVVQGTAGTKVKEKRVVEADVRALQLSPVREDLRRLATRAWSPARVPRDPKFLLDPRCLPVPTNAHRIEQALGLLYDHARKWAPGFEIPFRVPKVRLPLSNNEVPGLYRVDEHGYVFVDILPSLLAHPSSVLAVLTHEACHHILDLSGLNTHRPDVDEPMTDLAIFICGFGQVFLDGRTYLVSSESQWRKVHLGYLTDAHYKFAHEWVLQAASSRRDTDADGQQSDESQVRLLRNRLLNMLGGNQVALEGLLNLERRRQPGLPESSHYDTVIEQLIRGRR